MNRRFFLAGAAATVAVPAFGASNQTFLNGELNFSAGTFDWTNGGGDPLRHNWTRDYFRATLAMQRMNLSSATQRGLRNTMRKKASQRFDLRTYEDRVAGDVMVSGDGWVAFRPRVLTRRWRHGRSTMASWWSWTNRQNGERWEIIVPDVCSNFILTRLGQAVPCVCDARTDACATTS